MKKASILILCLVFLCALVSCGLEAEPAADGMLRSLEGYRDAIARSAAMNFVRWSPKGVKGYYRDSGTTPKTNTNRLFQWIRTRVEFMDSRYGAPAAQ